MKALHKIEADIREIASEIDAELQGTDWAHKLRILAKQLQAQVEMMEGELLP